MRNVVAVVQRGEMVHRIADEIETMIVELGVDARLLRLQLDETYSEIDDELDDVIADYLPPHRNADDTLGELARLRDDDVLDARTTLATLASRRRRPRRRDRPQGSAAAAPGAQALARSGGADRQRVRRAWRACSG